MENTSITNHGYKRMKERCNIKNHKTANKNIELAFKRGRRVNDFCSLECNYLISKEFDSCYAVAFNSYCYIFNQSNACVTVYALPKWFNKKKQYVGKRKIRNPKKYMSVMTDVIDDFGSEIEMLDEIAFINITGGVKRWN